MKNLQFALASMLPYTNASNEFFKAPDNENSVQVVC